MQVLGKYRNKLKQTDSHVFSLQMGLAGSFVIIVFLMSMVHTYKEDQLFRIPPDLRQGAVMRAGDIAPPIVYGFSYYILQQLNNWNKSGEKDFAERIYYLQAFLTPGFRKQLEEELKTKMKAGELRLRVRKIQEIVGRNYSEQKVLIESDNSWIVWLDIEVSETVHGKPVKLVNVQYPLRVVRYDVDPESNPWGLAIAGYESEPKKLTDEDLANPFRRLM